MNRTRFTPPMQRGRTIVVTGATAGIGYFAAEQLAAAGAHVVLASRTPAKLVAARDAILAQVTGARVDTVRLDLASPDSVGEAVAELAGRERLDALLLNGGAMEGRNAPTAWGRPAIISTHVLGNAALVAGLLPLLARTGTEARPSRIVHTSSGFVDRARRLDLRDPLRTPRNAIVAYTRAKLVTEVYALELDRRMAAAGAPVISLISRPGVGVDARTPDRPGVHDATTRHRRNPFTPWAQGKDTAAWSAVRAVTDPAARGGELYAPAGGLIGEPERRPVAAHVVGVDGEIVQAVWREVNAAAGVDVSGDLPAPSGRLPR
ncbi:MAG: alcohol dehydrogenase [Leifsonia xyli]|nr:MAG: alcohol dehydrogenase [Leifsonia xyli]